MFAFIHGSTFLVGSHEHPQYQSFIKNFTLHAKQLITRRFGAKSTATVIYIYWASFVGWAKEMFNYDNVPKQVVIACTIIISSKSNENNKGFKMNRKDTAL